jgi:hypothetical protein
MPTGQPPSGTVFNQAYLSMLDHEASDTPAEAEVSGPWALHPAGDRWAVSTEGEPPEVMATSHEIAQLAAALLPGTGRDLLFRLHDQANSEGYALVGLDGSLLAYLRHFNPELTRAMHVIECLRRDPLSLARVLHAARGPALARAGRIVWLWSQVQPAAS